MSVTITEIKTNGETPKAPMDFFLGAANNNKPSFPKRPEVDVAFKNISYSVVTSWRSIRPVTKTILHGISGEFRAGELTAIMGPSGAGKSTLLNILAGYTMKGSRGSVMYNGKPRTPENMEHLLRLSCYIQQDDYLRPRLTVRESMMIAAHLKLGINISYEHKMYQVLELLDLLGLTNHADTRTKSLSGGQKKRLSVALELITNPPIIFLDEPTSGLDSTSCSQCVQLLKELSRQGRTIVCTIHQPTALLFEKFDHLYGLAQGECIYQGSTRDLVSYFSKLDLCCPPYHNPADFLIDIGMGEYGANHSTLVQAASSQCRSERTDEIITSQDGLRMTVLKKHQQKTTDVLEFSKKQPSPPPLWAQTYRLLCRNIVTLRRNTVQFGLRMVAHLFISFVFGYLYYDVGSKANTLLGNYVFLYGSTLFLVYTGHTAVLLTFSLEVGVLKHEYFNRWYSLGPYMIATILVEVPFQVLCCFIYIGPSYYLTGQPLELNRWIAFVVFTTTTSLTAQSVGFLYGSILPITLAVFLGPVTIVLMSVFGFAIRLVDIPFYFVWLHYFSFVRAGFQSVVYSIYGYDRGLLPCVDNMYCHFRNPVKFLIDMDFLNIDPIPELVYICVFCFCAYFLTVFIIWRRLNRR